MATVSTRNLTFVEVYHEVKSRRKLDLDHAEVSDLLVRVNTMEINEGAVENMKQLSEQEETILYRMVDLEIILDEEYSDRQKSKFEIEVLKKEDYSELFEHFCTGSTDQTDQIIHALQMMDSGMDYWGDMIRENYLGDTEESLKEILDEFNSIKNINPEDKKLVEKFSNSIKEKMKNLETLIDNKSKSKYDEWPEGTTSTVADFDDGYRYFVYLKEGKGISKKERVIKVLNRVGLTSHWANQ